MTTKTYALQSSAAASGSRDAGGSVALGAIANPLAGRDLCSTRDLSPADVRLVLNTARDVKAQPELYRHALDARQLVMFFEKESLRTRLTFEAGMNTLGGSPIFIDQTGSRLGERETLADVAHNLERWVDAIVLRTYAHATITGMADFARVPVINALSDIEHPCQALTDIFTLEEHFGDLRGLNLAYVGDGNNVAHSLMLTAALMGANVTIATPAGYAPQQEFIAATQKAAEVSGGKVLCIADPREAAHGADAIYTDAWTSMGQERETVTRQSIFQPYQVDRDLMALAAPHAVFMHCLPAHRGEEVTDEVIDSAQSIVFDQAENRLHVQKAILLLLLDAVGPAADLEDARPFAGKMGKPSSPRRY
ncbi:MAG: ornithine carbamoyltransferase [Acidobacteriaceae bacterium]